MSETTISALPDIPLLNIFKRLPLNDLINGARLVCVGWRALLPTELNRRRHLLLTTAAIADNDDEPVLEDTLSVLREDRCHSQYWLEHVRHDDGSQMVRLPTLDQLKYHFVQLNGTFHSIRGPAVMNALPGITHLTVKNYPVHSSVLSAIIRMLNHWSGTLISLTLDLDKMLDSFDDNVTICDLFEAINRLESLRHLKLNLTTSKEACSLEDIVYPNLKILARLTTFCLTGNYKIKWFFKQLVQYGNRNAKLRQVCFHTPEARIIHRLARFGLEYPRLASLFTGVFSCHFRHWNQKDQQTMQRFCTHFKTLSELKLCLIPVLMNDLPQYLSRWQHLVALKLTISAHHNWTLLDQNEEAFKVRSVRLLHLTVEPTVSHENIDSLQIANIFPNLQVLCLIHQSLKCSTCEYDFDARPIDQLDNETQTKIYECARLARQSLRSCANLHTIEYNHNPFCYPDQSMRLVSPQQLFY